MTDSNRTSKGLIGTQVEQGRIKANFPRQYFGGKQVRKGLGLGDTVDGHAKANLIVRHLQLELEQGKLDDGNGNFNDIRFQEILREHGVTANLRVIKGGAAASTADNQLPPKPELSILEVWDIYCEFKKGKVQETTYQLKFKKDFLNPIQKAIAAVGEDALKIHNWLLENYSLLLVKSVLSHLSNAYQLCIRQKMLSYNPFDGLADNIDIKQKKEDFNNNDVENDDDVLDATKSFTWNEAIEILNYFENNRAINHWYPYVKFKFFTGCRPGEVAGLKWGDIFWDNEVLVFRRSYSSRIRRFKETKNGTKRQFPLPKNGELWNLLKSMPQGEPNDVVFKTKVGKNINDQYLYRVWIGNELSRHKGVIPQLIKQNKISKYLPPYNTRHTFINHMINDVGIPPHVVNAWCEHSEDVSKKHYRDLDLRVVPEYGSIKQNEKSEIELLREQNQMLMTRLEQMEKLIERLTEK